MMVLKRREWERKRVGQTERERDMQCVLSQTTKETPEKTGPGVTTDGRLNTGALTSPWDWADFAIETGTLTCLRMNVCVEKREGPSPSLDQRRQGNTHTDTDTGEH